MVGRPLKKKKEIKKGKRGRPKSLKTQIKEEVQQIEESLPRSNGKKPNQTSFRDGNNFGKGRVFGSRNAVQREMDAILENNALPLFNKVIEMAMAGNESQLQFLVRRIHPHTLKTFITMPTNDLNSLKDVSEMVKQTLNHVADGELALEDAEIVNKLLETRRAMIQAEAIEPRLNELEQLVGRKR